MRPEVAKRELEQIIRSSSEPEPEKARLIAEIDEAVANITRRGCRPRAVRHTHAPTAVQRGVCPRLPRRVDADQAGGPALSARANDICTDTALEHTATGKPRASDIAIQCRALDPAQWPLARDG